MVENIDLLISLGMYYCTKRKAWAFRHADTAVNKVPNVERIGDKPARIVYS